MAYHKVCNKSNTTGATSRAETEFTPGFSRVRAETEFTPGFSRVRVAQSFVCYICLF